MVYIHAENFAGFFSLSFGTICSMFILGGREKDQSTLYHNCNYFLKVSEKLRQV